jgi:uncharacterized protein YbcI
MTKPMQNPPAGSDGARPTATQDSDKPIGGELNAGIARAVVRIHRDSVGRGPTKAQAFFRGNVVVVVLEHVLAKEERTLVSSGHEDAVTALRHELLETMQPDLMAAVETLTDRRVVAMMGDTNLNADMAGQIFVLDEPIETHSAGAPPA